MKLAVFGDLHGSELKDLRKALDSYGPDALVCLGDFDQTRTISQFMEMEQEYTKSWKVVLTVPGNHDHALLADCYVSSRTLDKQGKSMHDLCVESFGDPEARRYIQSLFDYGVGSVSGVGRWFFLDPKRFPGEYRTIVIHGALDGKPENFPGDWFEKALEAFPDKVSMGDKTRQLNQLWNRLRKPDQHKMNFAAMKKAGYAVMLRGHDHEPEYATMNADGKIKRYNPDTNIDIGMEGNVMYTVTTGALFDGHYTTIDTGGGVPVVRYKRL